MLISINIIFFKSQILGEKNATLTPEPFIFFLFVKINHDRKSKNTQDRPEKTLQRIILSRKILKKKCVSEKKCLKFVSEIFIR